MWFAGMLGVVIAAWIVAVCVAGEKVISGGNASPCERARVVSRTTKRVPLRGKAQRRNPKRSGNRGMKAIARKANKRSIAKGTTCLIDLSNLIGAIGPEHIAFTLNSFAKQLFNQGYKAMFFMEHRAYHWAMCNQGSDDEKAEFKKFVDRKDFTLVRGRGGKGQKREADESLLQIAETVKESVCVSMDRFVDYAVMHPGIVGTDRVRRFSVARLDEKKIITIDGIPKAVVVDFSSMALQKKGVGSKNSMAVDSLGNAERRTTLTADKLGGTGAALMDIAERYLKRGDGPNAERMLVKAAKWNPTAYRALAEMYSFGGAVEDDEQKARHYDLLADNAEKRNRECHRRYLRIRGCGRGRHNAWKADFSLTR